MTVRVRELDRTPDLSRLYAKAVATGFNRQGGTLPDVSVTLDGVRADPQQLAAYDRVCGFDVRDTLPATYLHVLAFPLAVSLMTEKDFPFPLVGLVHMANRIVVYRPAGVGETWQLSVYAEGLRRHAKGQQFDVVAEASSNGETVWTGTSTYLRREAAGDTPGGSDGSDRKRADDERTAGERSDEDLTPGSRWRVPTDVGRRYAAVSGDRNPIHLGSLPAKAFGFPRAIAHGMWTKARCLAALQGRLPDAYTVGVTFRSPVLLGSTVTFASAPAGPGWRFAVSDGDGAGVRGRTHLTGTLG